MEHLGRRVQKQPPFACIDSCRKVPGLDSAPYLQLLNKVAVHYQAGTGRKSVGMKADHMIGIVASQS